MAAKQKTREAILNKIHIKSIVDWGGLIFDTIGKCLSFDLLPTYLQPQEERAKLKERTAAYEKDSSLLVASGRGVPSLPFANRDDLSHLCAQ